MSTISLSELERVQRAAADAKLSAEAAQLIAEQSAINAIPALLEIAHAAAAYMRANDDQTLIGDRARAASNAVLREALSKVKP